MIKVQLDLTPWLRGPHTGVGLSAFRCLLALQTYTQGEYIAVARNRPIENPLKIRPLNLWARWKGNREFIYHSFEGTLPSAKQSLKVLTIQDLWTLRKNPYQDPVFQRRQSKKIRSAIERADFLITSTQTVKDELVTIYPKVRNRVTVVPYAPLITPINPNQESNEVGQYLLEGRPFLLCVATLEVRKNLPFLFRALRKLSRLDLVLVGSLGYGSANILKELEQLRTSETRCLHFNGVSEGTLHQLYDKSLALVQPSLEEGFGMPIVEALHLGKPVILSQIPAHVELAGEAGLYFSLSDEWELRDQIERIRNDFEFQGEHQKLSRVRSELFSWKSTAEKLLKVYEGLGG